MAVAMNFASFRAACICIGVISAVGACKKDSASQGARAPGDARGGNARPAAAGRTFIKIDGSSTVFPISEAMAEEFQKTAKDVKVTVGVSGTGGGFKKFCLGETDISDASRPIKATEIAACAAKGIEFIELPIAFDGLAVLVNPKNKWAASMTTKELKRLWEKDAQGKVMKWSDVRTGWPDREIHLFGPGVDSGTYDYFTEAINHKEHSSRGDFTSSEDDNVLVQGIARDELALGFFGYAYYAENKDKLKLVAIDDEKPENGAGAILPSTETVRNGTYQPLSRPIFIYVSRTALERREVADFVRFYLANAVKLVAEVKYIPLPERAYVLAAERVAKRVVGSAFGGKGSQVGVSIEGLLQRGMPDRSAARVPAER